MAGKVEDDDRYSAEETARRADEVIKRMLNTPPKPRKAKPTPWVQICMRLGLNHAKNGFFSLPRGFRDRRRASEDAPRTKAQSELDILRIVGVRSRLSSRCRSANLGRRLVLTQTPVNDLPQQVVVVGPGEVLDLSDKFGPHPMHAAKHQHRSYIGWCSAVA
jgi:hypothetical protein